MIRNTALLSLASIVIAASVGPGTARALHLDVLSEQQNGRIVTGTGDFDHDLWTLGERVFHRDLGPTPTTNPTYLSNTNPGFNSIGAGSPDMPAGAQALLGNAIFSWDFLPMTITDGSTSLSQNLFYWNGQDSDGVPGFTPADVHFGAIPSANYRLSLIDFNGHIHSVDGTNTIVPGGKIALTAPGTDPDDGHGYLHQHLSFFLQDNDGNDATLPVDGFYLIAMRLKLPGLIDSLPVFMVFGTPGSGISAEDDAAYPWVEQQLNLPGDFNQDGHVDAADYVAWRQGLGTTYTQADYDVWRAHFGNASQIIVNTGSGAGSSESLVTGAVPEPASDWLFLLGGLMALARLGRQSSVGRISGFRHSI